MTSCYCFSEKAYQNCCEPYLINKQKPSTPEQLMRARYTAYAQGNIDYIMSTMKGEAAKDFNIDAAKIWAKKAKWLALEVVKASAIDIDAKVGFVEFLAHYLFDNKKYFIHEISEFHFEEDTWFYVDGQPGESQVADIMSEKIGRNDSCPCGSQKKYKKCCGKMLAETN